jgi:hypothetical protein
VSDAEPPQAEKNLTPHSRAPRAGADGRSDENLTTIVGFVGESSKEGQIRVYLDLSFDNYYEVPADDVVRTRSIDPDDSDSPRMLWIASSARVGLVRTDRTSGSASFVAGSLRARFAGRVFMSRSFGDDPILEDPYGSTICTPGPGTDWCYSVNPHLCPPPTSGVIFQCC